MNFFAQQERARGQTQRMVWLFVFAVASIVVAVNAVVALAIFFFSDKHAHQHVAQNPQVFFWTTLVTLSIIFFSTLYKIATLRAGGAAVARQLGAVPVPPDTTNFVYRRLRNVIEEVAIASGVPVPEIFVLEDEPGINAFAAGYTPSDAAVTVTRGCLQKLTRDELQGVIAHEFSHVLNGDMRLNIRLMGVLFGILVIAIIGQKVLVNSGRGDSEKGALAIAVVALAIMIIGFVGMFFGRLIKAGISRSREYLADASAVQFTRQTSGIAGALKKIGGLESGSKLHAHGEEVAHMLFGDGVGYSALFATHPPLIDRIKALEPGFNSNEFIDIASAWSQPVAMGEMEGAEISISGFAPAGITLNSKRSPVAALPERNSGLKLSAKSLAQQVGSPAKQDYKAAGAIQAAMPERLRAAAYMQDRAMQVIFALVLDADAAVRAKQLKLIVQYYDAVMGQGVEELLTDTSALHPVQRIPLAALAFPALRRRPRPALQTFLLTLNQLIQADGQVALMEYCLAKLINVQVIEALDPSRAQTMGRTKLPERINELATVFSIIAKYGGDDIAQAQRAYTLGMRELLSEPIPAYAPPDDWSLALDRSLPALNLLSPAGKELLVQGLTQAISADGIVTVNEAELLRTICACLHCPLPPTLEQAA